MSRIVNGIITVPVFTPTGNPGEYTFTGANFASQSDTTGNGAFLIEAGFIVYVPASDPNTFSQIPGVVHRYKLTTVNIVDSATLDGTILWDEDGLELDAPTNGIDSIIAMPTSKRRLGLPVDPAIYAGLSAGAATAAYNIDTEYILDNDVDVFAVDPIILTAGQFWYNSTDKVFRGYNGLMVMTLSTTDDVQTVQLEVDAVKNAVSLNVDGSFIVPTGTTYLDTATSVMDAAKKLDAAIVAETANRTNADATIQAEVDTKVSKTGDALTGNLTFDGVHTVTGLANPTNVSDAVTKGYVDSALSGLAWIEPVKQIVADKTTYTNTLVTGDRLIDTTDNKVYTVTSGGANGASATFNAGSIPVTASAAFTSDDETGYVFNGSAWVQFSGAGAIAAGNGLQKTGNTLAIQLDGSTLAVSPAGIKIKAAGVTATEIATSAVGSGLTGGAGTALSVHVGSGVTIVGGAVALDTTVTDAAYVKKGGDTMTGELLLPANPVDALGAATKQYVDALATKVAGGYFLYTASAAATSHTVTHNMNTKYVAVTVVDSTDSVIVPSSITFTDANNLTVTFDSSILCKVVVDGKVS